MAGQRRAEATPFLERLRPAMTAENWIASRACHRARIRATRWLAMTEAGTVALRHFLDLDLVGVEGKVAGNFRHGRKRIFISPDRIGDGFAVGIDAEIIRISLVGTMRHPLAA